MITGMLMGMAVSMMLAPQMSDTREALMDATRELAGRAGHVLRRSKSEIKEAMDH
jgi:hypothetical protein